MSQMARLQQLRSRIDLPVLRRAAGLLEGRHESIFKGHGQDFDDLSLYSPGDDVGDVDWKSSARAGIPIIKRFVQQSNVNVVLVMDIGRNMGALSSRGEKKSDIAQFVASFISYLARDRGDRVALVAGDAERFILTPPRASTQDLEVMLHKLAAGYGPDAPESDLNRVIKRAIDSYHRRSLFFIITDEVRPNEEHEQSLRKALIRHDVTLVRISDASPFVGARLKTKVNVQDVDFPMHLPSFLSGRPELQNAAARYVISRREQTSDFLRTLNLISVIVESENHAVTQFVDLVRRQKHANK